MGVALAPAAHAQGPAERASLHWVRGMHAEACVPPAALAAQVEEWLGPTFTGPSEASVFIEGMVLRDQTGFGARITVSRRDGALLGERTLRVEGESCDALKLQAAFVIAVTLDPDAALMALPPELEALLASEDDPAELLRRELEAEPERASTPFFEASANEQIAAPAEVPLEPVRSVEASPRPSPIRLARVSAGTSFGSLPGVSPVFALSTLWTRRYLGFELAGMSLLPQRVPLTPTSIGPKRTVRAWALRLRLALCNRPWGTRVWGMACASASASVYGGRGVDFDRNTRSSQPAWNTGGHAVLGARLSKRSALTLEGELLYHPVRVSYLAISPEGERTRSGSTGKVMGTILLGTSLRF